jgi:Ca2+-dependent lipid-binding protein
MSDSLRVLVVDGEFYKKQDVITEGDPYVTVTFNGQKKRTRTVNNSKKGVYNEGVFDIFKIII